MKDFFSMLPFLIFLMSVGLLILIGASIFLIRDLRLMRQEHLKGRASLWYKQPKTRSSLKWMGYALMIFLFAFGAGVINFLSRNIAIISTMGALFVFISINLVRTGSRLLRDLRSLQWERREGFPAIWYRRPKILMQIGKLLFLFGPLLSIIYEEDMLLAHAILHQPLSENTAPLVIIPGVFFLLAASFYFCAILVEALKRHTY